MTVISTDQRTKIQHRITVLMDLIKRVSTGEGEREAAKYALQTMQYKLRDLDIDLSADGWGFTKTGQEYYRMREGWYGAKYDGKYRSVVELNQIFRDEIKALRALGKKLNKVAGTDLALAGSDLSDAIIEMPAQIRVSVRKDNGYKSVYITLKNVPEDWWVDEVNSYGDTVRAAGPKLQKLADALYDLMTAWRYDRSDAQVDHFDTNFYPHVKADGHGRDWPYPQDLHRSRGY